MKANIRETIDKIERGETTPRQYPTSDVSSIQTPVDKIEEKAIHLSTKEKKDLKVMFGKIYEDIKSFLKIYIDMPDQHYELVTLWILGTYLHDKFETFPYLFINAMRGSGKTRLLKIIASLSKDGSMNTSMREAVLFRMGKKTLCLDEFEGVGSKEAQALREVLNASYKKGMKITRMKKQRNLTGGEEYVTEEFEPYKPIAMANIWGMEEVLLDRCISVILEKSSDARRTRLVEDFENHPFIVNTKKMLEVKLVQLVSFFSELGVLARWNLYVNDRYNYTTTYNTYTTLTALTTLNKSNPVTELTLQYLHKDIDFLSMFNKIHETNINGRNLELMMPFFVISHFISNDTFDKVLKIATETTKEKKKDEMTESKDVSLIDFISKFGLASEFVKIKKFTIDFREFVGDEEGDEKWINTKWVGRALSRLSLTKEKRRLKEGIEIIPNVQKAIEKIKLFKG